MSNNTTNLTQGPDRGPRSPTLWTTYHEIKAVIDVPLERKRVVQIIYDDSNRVVDMTEIAPNLFIGDEYLINIINDE